MKVIMCVTSERKQSHNDRPGVIIDKLIYPKHKEAIINVLKQKYAQIILISIIKQLP